MAKKLEPVYVEKYIYPEKTFEDLSIAQKRDLVTKWTSELQEDAKQTMTVLEGKLKAALEECENWAEQNNLSFTFSLEYGVGGTYKNTDRGYRWVSSPKNC